MGWMFLAEKSLEPKRNVSEIFNIFFGGRYIVFLMSIFSIYTGLIYNDIFSKSVNIFGSNWSAKNMTFGVMMSLWNKLSKKQYASIFLEFFPQIIFLLGIFGYLILMIFIKWVLYGANLPDPYSEHCAPNLLITFINMMLNKKAEVDMKMDGCHVGNKYLEVYMYPGQAGLQSFLVMFGVLMIPIMLLGKPAFILYQRRQRRAAYGTLRDELLESDHGGQQAEEEGFGEIMINQGIHTIEYVLGSVSHTASYLRLWALSLAHAQLSEVLWSMVMRIGFGFKNQII